MYRGHVNPSGGSAKFISSSITGFLRDKIYASDDIKAVECEDTPENTGEKGSVIREIDKDLDSLLQWLVCLLLFNKFLLKYLFAHLEGLKLGPTS